MRNTPGWYEVVTVLNRPLAENMLDEVLEVIFIRRKIGLQHKTDLRVTMKRLTSKSPAGTGTLIVTPTFEKLANGDVKCCEWTLVNESGFETLPAAIKSGLDQAKTLNGYIKEHVSYAMEHIESLGSNALPEGTECRKPVPCATPTAHSATSSAPIALRTHRKTRSRLLSATCVRRPEAPRSVQYAGGTSGGRYGDSYP